jgi:hypothetical protein
VKGLEKYRELLGRSDLAKGVTIGERTFVGEEAAVGPLAALTKLSDALGKAGIMGLYERTIAHDGLHDEDIYGSGRHYAYFLFELKGQSPQDKERLLSEALAAVIQQFGRDEVLPLFPPRIKGRQVTQNLSVRPENDDYPNFYSKSRMSYAEKMAVDEVPDAVLDRIREKQDRILDAYDWYPLMVADPRGKVLELCGDVYLVPDAAVAAVGPYAEAWNALVDKGVEGFYDIDIATDGVYPADENNQSGRFYAYVRAELKGMSAEGRAKFLQETLPPKVVKAVGAEELAGIFPARVAGDLVTQPLTIRPEEDQFASHFNRKKVDSGRLRVVQQVLNNVRSALEERAGSRLGAVKKYIILEKSS